MKAVFSDIDGTLSKGFVTVDFIRYLGDLGKLNQKAFLYHEKLMQDYSDKKIKYIDLVPKWSKAVADCFKGFNEKELHTLADTFFGNWKKERIYSSTKPLMELLKSKGYSVFLISAGWEYLANLYAKEIGAKEVAAIKIKVQKGKYTNVLENDIYLEKGKAKAIKKLIRKYKIDKKHTIGLGDSIQDKAIFENVHKPIALNPSTELREKALKEKWFIATHENILEVMNNCFNKEKR